MTKKTTANRLLLHFGRNDTWEIANTESIASYLMPAISPIEDVESAVEAALANPLEFPSLHQAVVPGDNLVFAVDPCVPSLLDVLFGVIQFFQRRGTPVSDMRIVLAGQVPELAKQIAVAMKARFGDELPIDCHDPDDSKSVAYVAADEESNPIYVNRIVVDADVVVPITCGRAPYGLDNLGAYSVFPLLSDRITRGKFYSLSNLENPVAHQKLSSLADQAAWWTGFMTTVQVIPAGQDRAGAVIAGATAVVEQVCREKMSAAWDTPTVEVDLTIALLDGGDAHQSWLGIARALYAARRCTAEGGTLVVCTSADVALGESIQSLRDARLDQADISGARQPSVNDSDDAIAASLIEQATQDRHVYLISKLPREVVESLGLGVIEDAAELSRLIEQFTSCVILGSAQYRSVVKSES